MDATDEFEVVGGVVGVVSVEMPNGFPRPQRAA